MPALLDRSDRKIHEVSMPQLQGPGGQELSHAAQRATVAAVPESYLLSGRVNYIENVVPLWEEFSPWAKFRKGSSTLQTLEETELEDYRPVPAQRIFTVPVRYVVRGRGKPMPFDFDFDDEEE
jgi:hypothetical protein